MVRRAGWAEHFGEHGEGAEEECVNGRGHGISEEGGGRNVEVQGADHFGRGQRRKVLMVGVGYFGGVGGGKKRWRTGADHFGEHMTCILKDMRQGEGLPNGRGIRAKVGNKGQEISEDWGMTFWRPVVGGRTFWRIWHIHFGEHIFRRTEGGEMSKGRAMCT